MPTCTHIVIEELMENCASASSRPGSWLTSQIPLAARMSGLTGARTLYITMPVCAMSTSIVPVLQSAKAHYAATLTVRHRDCIG